MDYHKAPVVDQDYSQSLLCHWVILLNDITWNIIAMPDDTQIYLSIDPEL